MKNKNEYEKEFKDIIQIGFIVGFVLGAIVAMCAISYLFEGLLNR